MLAGAQLVLAIAAAASALAWLLAAGALYLLRKPPEPPVGPRTLDLGAEPPAVANFLVNDFRLTSEAVPATLIDLAARDFLEIEQRGPGTFYVRLRETDLHESLSPYEARVLAHLRARASDGVVPAGGLTTGPQEQSRRWRRAFEQEVVSDAKARGLSRDALDGPAFTVLTLAALVPALLVWVLSDFEAGILVLAAAVGILGWVRARHPQRETAEGMSAASRWLGVRAALAENAVFDTHSPLTVEIWDRLLAYGAALGVASGASRPLPMAAESDTLAWSAHGGPWRAVRISYPRFWPPGWGVEPLIAAAAGVGAVLAGALTLYFLGPPLVDALGNGWWSVISGAFILFGCSAVVIGAALAVMAWADTRGTAELTGVILRLRAFGDDEDRRYYVALDDGTSDAVRAFRVRSGQYAGLEQGWLVTARVTANLGCVRSIVRSDGDS